MTDRLRAAAEAALEALERARAYVYETDRPQTDAAMDALRAVLAELDRPTPTGQRGGMVQTIALAEADAMTIKMYPIEFEAVDEIDSPLFKVRCFDEATSAVEVSTVVTPGSWLELSAKIHEALLMIHPEQEGEA